MIFLIMIFVLINIKKILMNIKIILKMRYGVFIWNNSNKIKNMINFLKKHNINYILRIKKKKKKSKILYQNKIYIIILIFVQKSFKFIRHKQEFRKKII